MNKHENTSDNEAIEADDVQGYRIKLPVERPIETPGQPGGLIPGVPLSPTISNGYIFPSGNRYPYR